MTVRRLKRFLFLALAAIGAVSALLLVWFLAGWPLGFDKICIRSQQPIEADYIVCVGGGVSAGQLPSDEGWQRIYTAVQLYLDGWGNKIVFTGGGSGRLSEAEIYAEAAGWLGMAAEDAVLDPGPNQTSEHPRNILALAGAGMTTETRLNIVTSPLHTKRTALCFAKAGFMNFRMVAGYRATGVRKAMRAVPSERLGEPDIVKEVVVSRPDSGGYIRAEKESRLPDFRPSRKAYNDLFLRLKRRSSYFFTALRELAALAAYKAKGYI